MKQLFVIFIASYLFVSCASKQPIKTSSATILFKTPIMKFYDKGFIQKYDNYITLNILNAGISVLNLQIYKDEVCQSTLECISSKEFNKKYLDSSYKDDFLYALFSHKKIYFKDNKKKIFIKVKWD
ncbi:MAG: hypothetical protein KAJ49_02060 [Arcobacteraceae bacterium]|nr:hypothetical protein [Arcobacteraceae bacterium]